MSIGKPNPNIWYGFCCLSKICSNSGIESNILFLSISRLILIESNKRSETLMNAYSYRKSLVTETDLKILSQDLCHVIAFCADSQTTKFNDLFWTVRPSIQALIDRFVADIKTIYFSLQLRVFLFSNSNKILKWNIIWMKITDISKDYCF